MIVMSALYYSFDAFIAVFNLAQMITIFVDNLQ